MSEKLIVDWLDSGQEPKCAPNPAYPDGQDDRRRVAKERPESARRNGADRAVNVARQAMVGAIP